MYFLQKLHVFGDARNKFLECWNFANRIPYEEGRVVEVLSHCLEEFHGVVCRSQYNVKLHSQYQDWSTNIVM